MEKLKVLAFVMAGGEDGLIGEFATRLTGSADLYAHSGRRPYASINFITCHDGFTLADLVSYNDKHNGANGEDNRDGESHNRAWNCGVEGPTDDSAINALRGRQKRNLLATLIFSQGVPMLTAGDELGRSQRGNNNAYCQDNTLTWLNWEAVDQDLFEFTLPPPSRDAAWMALLDTARPRGLALQERFRGGQAYPLMARSFAFLIVPRLRT